MQINYVYLSILILEFLIIMGVGVWANRRVKATEDYAVAGRNLGVFLAWGSFGGAFVSAVSIIGGVGYASNFGWSYLVFLGLGVEFGLICLVLLAKKVHESGAQTVPEMLFQRYKSRKLRAFSALAIIIAYSVTLITQLFAAGVVVETIVGIPKSWAIMVIGIVFLIYTVMGGLTAVARTDTLQTVIMTVGMLLTIIVIFIKVPSHVFFSHPFDTVFQGDTKSGMQIFAWILVWGLGVASEPYYLNRIFASKTKKVASKMIGFGSLFAVFIYSSIVIIGIGAHYLAPGHLGNDAFPFLAKNVLPSAIGVVVMVTLMAAILSTIDSILNVVGVYWARDIHKNLFNRELTDKGELNMSRIATLIFGILCIVVAFIMSFKPLPAIATFASYAWGIIGSTLFIPIVAGFLFSRLNPRSGLYSSVLGFIGAIGGKLMVIYHVTSINEIFWGVGLAIIGLLAGMIHSQKIKGDHNQGHKEMTN
ncbi:Na+/proline symporter [Scopulibacillus darangshiensis]|uniref:Na+/proline symporter n=1 Tax=Scopulibacillus darangshiensis TaxID=442528 RepID=A0A4R2NIY6_9BACL|nr:sodium:solute symporter family protein [Scopulibacillus darangshiensis]TCP21175.1 Na+/proline symporter [Scopulibacillus darangshiensis]